MSEPIGQDFISNGKTVQEGVNPNSLTPAKDLNTLNDRRIQNAIKNSKAVDVTIGY